MNQTIENHRIIEENYSWGVVKNKQQILKEREMAKVYWMEKCMDHFGYVLLRLTFLLFAVTMITQIYIKLS